MTCEECELLLAQDEISPEVEAHVAGCADCRSLAGEFSANADALRGMSEETMPPVRRPEAGTPWWKWSSAAAAIVITLGAAWWVSRPPKPPQIVSIDVNVTGVAPQSEVPYVKAEIPAKLTPAIVPADRLAEPEPLQVKMLTPDPDVVIYWLIDSKGE